MWRTGDTFAILPDQVCTRIICSKHHLWRKLKSGMKSALRCKLWHAAYTKLTNAISRRVSTSERRDFAEPLRPLITNKLSFGEVNEIWASLSESELFKDRSCTESNRRERPLTSCNLELCIKERWDTIEWYGRELKIIRVKSQDHLTLRCLLRSQLYEIRYLER